ncbi:MAG: agmatine deiminase family protein [Bdellovibrionota bacterium]
MIKYSLILTLLSINLFVLNSFAAHAENLPIGLTEKEKPLLESYLQGQMRNVTAPPMGPVHSLGEWEEADAAMTLWQNDSLIKALSEHGNVKILTQNNSGKNSWLASIKNLNLDESKFSFYIVPTDSIWIRDYGPWWIVDGSGKFGIVDTIYNRPRPEDDVVPEFIGRQLDVPVYKPGLVHTGGNYYSDGLGNAFSSTLVETENNNFSVAQVLERMLNFLGINSYTRSELGKNATIEHLDTFGKLVAPDTWVFSEFPKNSRFYTDAERMVQILKSKVSPYGTPYKIFRLRMNSASKGQSREYYRAYINSFISNGALYFPTYGDAGDDEAKRVYQQALPGYKIVGVDAEGTEWGDSVHCRTRNLIKKDTIFIFPQIQTPVFTSNQLTVSAEIIPSPNSEVLKAEAIFVENGNEVERLTLILDHNHTYKAQTNKKSGEFYISVTDTSGKTKTHPLLAPKMLIRY